MLFSAPSFFLFFAFYFLLHRNLPLKYRRWLIIGGSTFFYAYWNIHYVALPALLTLLAFSGAIWIVGSESTHRRLRLTVTVILLLTPLFVFKYLNFFAGRHLIDALLPLGISFLTFTLIGYVVDVANAKTHPELSYPRLLSATLFFPHLIAGPIVRPNQLIPPLERLNFPTRATNIFAITLFTWGLFKKLVFADQIAPFVDGLYSRPAALNPLESLLAIYGFTVQIYCDFSGYTDMALGLAALLGVRLPANFKRPYLAQSPSDFWRRWHITLSNWLRDYLYIPLGGNRWGALIQVRNLLITFLLGGLWHGASFNFLIWGLAHGIALALVNIYDRVIPSRRKLRMPRFLKVFLTFHFVALVWIFFRAPNVASAKHIFAGLFAGHWLRSFGAGLPDYGYCIGLIGIALLTHAWDSRAHVRLFVHRWPRALMMQILFILWSVAMALGAGGGAQFIYFDF